jgi:hypothetical protein
VAYAVSGTLVFLGQVLGGFHEPPEVVIGCAAAGLAACLAVLPWVPRKHPRAGPEAPISPDDDQPTADMISSLTSKLA